MNQIPITHVMDVTSETLRRLEKGITDIDTSPQTAAWFNFFCDIQTKKMRNLAKGKTHNFVVFLQGFFAPKGYTIEVHAAFDKTFFQLYKDVIQSRMNLTDTLFA